MLKKIVIIISIILGVLLVLVGGSFLWIQYKINKPLNADTTLRVFMIREGEGSTEIGEALEKERFISSKFYFYIYIWQNNVYNNLKPGEYELASSMNIPEITEVLTKGTAKPDAFTITILEGWTNEDIAEYLEKKELVPKDDFFKQVSGQQGKFTSSYEFLIDKPEDKNLQGYLFPDTYKVSAKQGTEYIVKKILDNFDRKFSGEFREEVGRQGKTIFEIVTIASILEREVKTEEDKKIIAGIFYKRLKEDKFLQSCATVEYILQTKKRILSYEDTRIDSPYNTYINKGLPPGPICNPGLDSIKAVIYPESTDYLFFLSTEEGEIIYSKTDEEHAENKEKYLR
ncbi:endolytic transglycosylase MltG [bacterium (Candidatus Torokbacteria) CG_4_10_14_0_2_um_filter_35_8]|nr:MAG: endolytic transglycosylase MltG [bacterium (Candidatus Torokbacteria) CG_4_10_14_0_2_um_filter_35_8]